jgi:hypothetical protein
MQRLLTHAALALAIIASAAPARADQQAAIDGCIDRLRQVGGPDGQSGQVLSSEYSEAGTLVMIRDAGGTVWRCIGYNNGRVGELAAAEGQKADDGGGAMAGAAAKSTAGAHRVKFDRGASGAELPGSLPAGESARYVLGAKNGQNLYVRVAGAGLEYQIFNPDKSFLLDLISADREYRGQLWQSGDHVVEVVNRGRSTAAYRIIIGID